MLELSLGCQGEAAWYPANRTESSRTAWAPAAPPRSSSEGSERNPASTYPSSLAFALLSRFLQAPESGFIQSGAGAGQYAPARWVRNQMLSVRGPQLLPPVTPRQFIVFSRVSSQQLPVLALPRPSSPVGRRTGSERSGDLCKATQRVCGRAGPNTSLRATLPVAVCWLAFGLPGLGVNNDKGPYVPERGVAWGPLKHLHLESFHPLWGALLMCC